MSVFHTNAVSEAYLNLNKSLLMFYRVLQALDQLESMSEGQVREKENKYFKT